MMDIEKFKQIEKVLKNRDIVTNYIEKIFKSDNFFNSQNYVNSKLQKKLPFLSSMLVYEFPSVVDKWYCFYNNTKNSKWILFIIGMWMLVFGFTKILIMLGTSDSAYSWMDFLWFIIHVLLFFVEMLGFMFIMVYVLLRVSGYNILKMKVFITFVWWKKYTVCKVWKI